MKKHKSSLCMVLLLVMLVLSGCGAKKEYHEECMVLEGNFTKTIYVYGVDGYLQNNYSESLNGYFECKNKDKFGGIW